MVGDLEAAGHQLKKLMKEIRDGLVILLLALKTMNKIFFC